MTHAAFALSLDRLRSHWFPLLDGYEYLLTYLLREVSKEVITYLLTYFAEK